MLSLVSIRRERLQTWVDSLLLKVKVVRVVSIADTSSMTGSIWLARILVVSVNHRWFLLTAVLHGCLVIGGVKLARVVVACRRQVLVKHPSMASQALDSHCLRISIRAFDKLLHSLFLLQSHYLFYPLLRWMNVSSRGVRRIYWCLLCINLLPSLEINWLMQVFLLENLPIGTILVLQDSWGRAQTVTVSVAWRLRLWLNLSLSDGHHMLVMSDLFTS